MKTAHLGLTAGLALGWSALILNAQNLVTNPGFEAGNTGFTTDYTLWSGQPGWGVNLYYVTNNPHNASPFWTSTGDHTTGSGKMLIVDGSATAGRVFWRQTVSVATNTSYVFSAWALKFESQSPPILYFTVNGRQQGTFHVLPLTPSGWQGYGAVWNAGTTNTALLELRLQSTAGGGNNLAVDDIAFIPYTSAPLPAATVESAVQIAWPSDPGIPYQVQWRSALETNITWLPLGGLVTGDGAVQYFCDPLGTNQGRFYRIVLPP